MSHREQFMSWWKDDPERAKCFLGQAMDAYVKSFPARVLPLLEEVFLPYKCPRCEHEVQQGPPDECPVCCKSNLLPSTTDHDLSVPGIAEQGDHTERPVEGGVFKELVAWVKNHEQRLKILEAPLVELLKLGAEEEKK